MVVTITDVKVFGICSKCRTEDDEVHKYKDGSIVPDKDIECIGCELLKPNLKLTKGELEKGSLTK